MLLSKRLVNAFEHDMTLHKAGILSMLNTRSSHYAFGAHLVEQIMSLLCIVNGLDLNATTRLASCYYYIYKISNFRRNISRV